MRKSLNIEETQTHRAQNCGRGEGEIGGKGKRVENVTQAQDLRER